MTINEFIREFTAQNIKNTQVNPNAVGNFIREKLEVKTYLPFIEKRDLCAKVLEASCKNNGGIVEVDSVSRYLMFTIAMLTNYTNLTFENTEGSDPIDQYDMLCQSGLLNPILDCIGAEYSVCNEMLNMMMADINANQNNMAAVLNTAAQKLLDIVGEFADVLKDKVEDWELDLSQLDINKYLPLLEKLGKK